jgi:large subunit ribosomal protein L21
VSQEDVSLIGQPWVENATVEVTVMQHSRAKKVIVYKMQPKKKTRKKNGHRQNLTRIMVDSINLDGNVDIESNEPNESVEAA